MIMKLKIKESILRNGKRFEEGETIELPDHIATNWIKKGFANKIAKKKSKVKFETKEFKVEHIENKDDATN